MRQSPVNGAHVVSWHRPWFTARRPTLRVGTRATRLFCVPCTPWPVLFVLLHQRPHLRMLANRLQSTMHEHPNVPFLLAGDVGDLLVAEAIGPQVNRFTLA